MLGKETGSRAHILYLIIGLVSFLLIGADTISAALPGFPVFTIAPFWQRIFVAWLFIGHLLYIKNFIEATELFNVEQLFGYVIMFGLIALPLNYINEILIEFNFSWFPTPVNDAILTLLKNYSMILYFIFCFILFRKLVFVKKTKQIINRWNIFGGWLIAVTVVAPLSELFLWHLDDLLYWILIGIGASIGLTLVFQLKWIALLDSQSKWKSIAFLTMISTISVLLILKLLNEQDNYIINGIKLYNLFMILLVSFSSLYGVVSLLALVFNLPVSSVLEQQKKELESFQEINQIIKNKVNIEDILEHLFTACILNTHAEAGWLTYKLDITTGQKKTLKAVNVTDTEIEAADERINMHNLIYPEMPRDYVYVSNMRRNERFDSVQTNFDSLLICPIITKGVVIGKIVLLKTFKGGFDEYMIKLALSYIDQAKIAIQNARSLEEALETERLKEELAIAEKIQKSLLGQEELGANGSYDIAAISESAKEVGGDYYDFYSIDKDRSAIVIGDVSGKGTSAAFHMAELKGIFQALMQLDLSPEEFMIRTNSALNNCLEKSLFITLSYFHIDSAKKQLCYSRAGHCPVLRYSAEKGEAAYLEDEGIGLGIIRTEQFSEYVSVHELPYQKDDIILLYSDGIVEARHADTTEEYGYDRLKEVLENVHSKSAEEIKQVILENLLEFTGDGERDDDLTLVVLKFTKN